MSSDATRQQDNERAEPGPRLMDGRALIEMLDEWSREDSDYDERVMQLLRKALDEDRLSYRKLYPACD